MLFNREDVDGHRKKFADNYRNDYRAANSSSAVNQQIAVRIQS